MGDGMGMSRWIRNGRDAMGDGDGVRLFFWPTATDGGGDALKRGCDLQTRAADWLPPARPPSQRRKSRPFQTVPFFCPLR